MDGVVNRGLGVVGSVTNCSIEYNRRCLVGGVVVYRGVEEAVVTLPHAPLTSVVGL